MLRRSPRRRGPEGAITVFAAASLGGTFTELAEQFEAANPGTTVQLNIAGSADLATQIIEGAPADVFASADENNMSKVVDAGLVDGDPVDFATNALEIAVPAGQPGGRRRARRPRRTGSETRRLRTRGSRAAPRTATAARAGGVALSPVSEESSVTDVLGKVTSGEADAGLVYVTDVIAAGDAVEGIAFAESAAAITTYPIAALAHAEGSAVAAAFVAFVTGEAGTAVLGAAGFGRPIP